MQRHAVRRALRLLALAAAFSPALPAPAEAQTGTLIVLNKSEASATLIDLASGRIVATLPTGEGPHELVVSRDGRWAVGGDYGAATGGSTLTLIDVPAKKVARTIDLGAYTRPHGLAFVPGDSLLAVTSETARSVVLVRIPSGEISHAVPTAAAGSHMVAMVGDGATMYTGNIGSNTVSRLAVDGEGEARLYDTPPQPEAIGVTPSGSEVWVGSNSQGLVTVIDPATGQTKGTLEGFGFPYRVAFTPDERVAIVPDPRNHRRALLRPRHAARAGRGGNCREGTPRESCSRPPATFCGCRSTIKAR